MNKCPSLTKCLSYMNHICRKRLSKNIPKSSAELKTASWNIWYWMISCTEGTTEKKSISSFCWEPKGGGKGFFEHFIHSTKMLGGNPGNFINHSQSEACGASIILGMRFASMVLEIDQGCTKDRQNQIQVNPRWQPVPLCNRLRWRFTSVPLHLNSSTTPRTRTC